MDTRNMTTFPRYTANLRRDGNKIYSYTTHVATIVGSKLYVHGWWSVTTSKHINYVANHLGLTKTDLPKEQVEYQENKGSSMLKSVAMVAKIGDILCDTDKEANDWKTRMLKAGLGEGISLPDDWDSLPEDEKKRRLDGGLNILIGKETA